MKTIVATIVLILTLSTNATFASISNLSSTNGITWIKVLIAEGVPPSGKDKNTGKDLSQQYVDNIKNNAPNLEQFHIRVKGDSDAKIIASVVTKLIATDAFGNTLKLGYHPDLSKGSYGSWSCNKGDTPCIMKKAIIKLYEIEKAVKDKNGQFTGFDIFSLEQSYIINGFTQDKYNPCFSPTGACPIPGAKPTMKKMQIGNVLGAGSGTDTTIYGSTTLQWGYPQLYNLKAVKQSQTDFNDFLQDLKTTGIITKAQLDIITKTLPPEDRKNPNILMIDACLGCSCHKITHDNNNPNLAPWPKIITSPESSCPRLKKETTKAQGNLYYSSYHTCQPSVAATYLAQTAADSLYMQTTTPSGGIVWMLSGEPSFLGANCKWNAKQLNDFITLLKKILVYQCQKGYPEKNCDTNKFKDIKFGIWSFHTMPIFTNNPTK